MLLFNIQNENDEIVCLQNKRITNNTTQTKHANKLEPKLTELVRTKPVVFKLFHTVAHFPTQGNVTTHFGTEL